MFSGVLVPNIASAGGAPPLWGLGGTKRVFWNFSSYKGPNLMYYSLLHALLYVETIY